MEKSGKPKKPKPTYWAIFDNKKMVFDGTHTECWNMLVAKYGSYTMADLDVRKIRIGRKS